MAFHVGQKVVCVDDSKAHICVGGLHAPIVKGAIYTVSKTGLFHSLDPARVPCIQLAEIDWPMLWARRFRPIEEQKTDISIFKAMLNPSQVTVDAMNMADFARELAS